MEGRRAAARYNCATAIRTKRMSCGYVSGVKTGVSGAVFPMALDKRGSPLEMLERASSSALTRTIVTASPCSKLEAQDGPNKSETSD